MRNIIIITASFPYLPGEQFLEAEAEYYSKYQNNIFTIMPIRAIGQKRDIDSSIKIDDYLIKNINISRNSKLFYLAKSLGTKYFYKELFSNNLFNIKKMKIFLNSISIYQNYYNAFDRYLKHEKNLKNTIIYTYWNNEITYALQSLKSKYDYKLVSRIHGIDLYRERKAFGYMPLKKQFTEDIDKLYLITESVNEYLHQTYGFNYDVLELSRLGVEDLNIISSANNNSDFHIVSCSFLVEIKRADKIIKALEIVSKKLSFINFSWSHIGGGKMYDKLLALANNRLSSLPNVSFDFIGNLDNKKVYEFYRNNKVDVFINVSESEGVPVSIMEAMSCHIPIIAPDVGGISDMVLNGVNGSLLSSKCGLDEVVGSLENVSFFKHKNTREQSYNIFLEKYNAEVNYSMFMDSLLSKKLK